MKQIYEIPEVTIFEVGPAKVMLNGSPTIDDVELGGSEDVVTESWGNSNSMDDQSTPWYRR